MPLPDSTSSPARDEVLVRFEGVSKKFCRSLKQSLWYGVRDIAAEFNLFVRRDSAETTPDAPARDESLRPGEFWAVRDVSFELRRGECLGLIGHNGAGKTTLLKMLNGLVLPDTGHIEMRGRVGALIALGAGFNPILSGRENIYVNGAVLGLGKREIDRKFDEIVDFAELRDFIDAPVKSYSSGMAVRLGFAVATALEPDILILDEVLAVGDIGFVIKCLNRIRTLCADAAVILVSHQMPFISSFCSRVTFMDHGRMLVDTVNLPEALERYYALARHESQLSGSGDVRIDCVKIFGTDGQSLEENGILQQGSCASIELQFSVFPESETAKVCVAIDDHAASQVITYPLVDESGEGIGYGKGGHRVKLDLGRIELNSGKYSILVYAWGSRSKTSWVRSQGNAPFTVLARNHIWSKLVRPTVAVPLG